MFLMHAAHFTAINIILDSAQGSHNSTLPLRCVKNGNQVWASHTDSFSINDVCTWLYNMSLCHTCIWIALISAYRFKRQREPLSLWSVPHSTPLCTKIKLWTRHTPPLTTGCSLLEVLELFSLSFFFTNKPYYKRNMANRVRYLNKYTSYISFVESLHFYRSFPRRVSCTLA